MSGPRRRENPNISDEFGRRYDAEISRLMGGPPRREGADGGRGGGNARNIDHGDGREERDGDYGRGLSAHAPPLNDLEVGRHGTVVSGLTGVGSAREAMLRNREGGGSRKRSRRERGRDDLGRSRSRERRSWRGDDRRSDRRYDDRRRGESRSWSPDDRRHRRRDGHESSHHRRRHTSRRSDRSVARTARGCGRTGGRSPRGRSGSGRRSRSHSYDGERRRREEERIRQEEHWGRRHREERRAERRRREERSPGRNDDRRRRRPGERRGEGQGGNGSPAYIVSEDSDNPHAGAVAAAPGGKSHVGGDAPTGDAQNAGNRGPSDNREETGGKAGTSPKKRSHRDREGGESGRRSRDHRSSRRHRSPSGSSSYRSRSSPRRSMSPHRRRRRRRSVENANEQYNPAPRGLNVDLINFSGTVWSASPERYKDDRASSDRKRESKKRRKHRRNSSASNESRSRSRRRDRLDYSGGKRARGTDRSYSPPSSRKRRRRRRDHRGEFDSRDRRSFSRSESQSRNIERGAKRKSKKKKQKKSRRHRSDNNAARGQSESSRDDTVGHFRGGPGTTIDHRYRIVRDVGLGTFGRVVQCEQVRGSGTPGGSRRSASRGRHDDNPTVAIKIVRNVPRYHESALIEGDICERVNREQSRQNKDLCAKMLDRFSLPSGHYCLVFECLGCSLYDYLKAHDYAPFPMYCVRDFSRQLLEVLDFLHGFGLIHTDLKPENILLSSNGETTYRSYDGSTARVPVTTKVKVIDFGGATYNDEKKSSIVNTRQYRAPEVILGWGWSYPSDLWSAGCIIAELYQGELLFATHDNAEHLALMERAVGPFRKELLDQSTSLLAKECFDSKGWHRIRGVLSSRSIEHVRKQLPIEQVVTEHDRSTGLGHLLRSLLIIDPNRRATAREALVAPFFTQIG